MTALIALAATVAAVAALKASMDAWERDQRHLAVLWLALVVVAGFIAGFAMVTFIGAAVLLPPAGAA